MKQWSISSVERVVGLVVLERRVEVAEQV